MCYPEHRHIHFHIVCDCFLPSSYGDRDHMACKAGVFTVWPFIEICRLLFWNYEKISELGPLWVSLPHLGQHGGVIQLTHPEANDCSKTLWFCWVGVKNSNHSTTSLSVIRKEYTECWQLYILKDQEKKKTALIHHPCWQDRVPIQEREMCQFQHQQ